MKAFIDALKIRNKDYTLNQAACFLQDFDCRRIKLTGFRYTLDTVILSQKYKSAVFFGLHIGHPSIAQMWKPESAWDQGGNYTSWLNPE